MNTIVVAVDFSDATPALIAMGEKMSRAFGSRLYLLHIAEPDPEFVGYEAGPQSVRDTEARHLRQEHRDLQALADGIRTNGFEVTALVIQGPTVEKILEEVDKLGAELVIVGSEHGQSVWRRFFIGSTSEGLIRAERCPVLVVPNQS